VIRVLIVDDSAVVRKILTDELTKFPDISVVGSAIDPYAARDLIVKHRPDVITLDIEMPRMDGLTFLAKLMKHHPVPVVIVSSLTPKNSEAAVRALELGAVEVVCKPGSTFSTPDVPRQLIRSIRVAASSRVRASLEDTPGTAPPPVIQLETTHKVIAIGASTGGTKAIQVVLSGLPRTTPGTMIVQHMPEYFTASFADRLNQICQMEVREARDNDILVPGLALVAPGNRHALIERSGTRYVVRLKDGPAVHHQRPSVDVMFDSMAQSVGRNGIGIILTGMGADGARGLLDMRNQGAHTIAEHESSCVVYGMPHEAIKLGAADEIAPLPLVSGAILRFLKSETVPSPS
jgi:two-component system chemotaxis response regulator CheB